ncbi:MAG: DivIVA domain-containing protein [Actinomycetia bacterium]|nr:DivIVA domain-containing protein [Actinomycetes bacterium]
MEKIAFQTQGEGYAPQEVDAFVSLILENYEELLTHYQELESEIEPLKTKLGQLNEPQPSAPDYSAEALELLSEATKVSTQARKQTKARITALIDQAALHVYRLEESSATMKEELDKMYAALNEQL